MTGLRKYVTQVVRINIRAQSVAYLKFILTYIGLVHTFRFSTGRQVPIIAGQNSGAQ